MWACYKKFLILCTMQVVFLQAIKGSAKRGEIKNVKPGYFRNFLLPRGIAVLATEGRIKETEKIRKNEVIAQERLKAEAHEVKAKLSGLKITLKAKAKGDKLYGSITEKEIIAAVKKEAKVGLEKENFGGAEHLKTVGTHEVKVHLAEGVNATVTVVVEALEEKAAAKKTGAKSATKSATKSAAKTK